MLIKKIVSIIFIMILTVFTVGAVNVPDLSAKSAIIINGETGEVLFEKDADTRRSMASTTKIMTAVLAAESGRMYDTVNVTAEMTGAEGTSIGLKAGYKLKLYDLVYGMMLESGNDAANATAIFLAGSMSNFAGLMNAKAKEIGMTGSNFVTPSGLDDENHYTTARDMAILGAYAMKNPFLREICSTKSKRIDFIEPDICVTFSNHNRLLSAYDGTIGIKTGFTKKSGRCLVSAAERDGTTYIAVTLSAGDDWNDHKKMFNAAFSSVQMEDIYLRMPETITVQGSTASEIKITAAQYPYRYAYNANQGKITQQVYLPKFVYAPIEAGDKLGFVNIYCGGKLIATDDIIAAEDAQCVEPTYVEKISFIDKIKMKINDILHRV
ncbi:MAG: D-alanyl-D-alanine carboxypeptidase [Faecalibacterium sp.]|nr:D-alanyl-D-alanine carboxypeptidase [Ruminococcus sp.]MCM1392237.1 D-alanyl-D-alanine carboxypeptidase [Ruminococcus sp.]MCM1484940.1 D-alanyl-D-alanine carboxypeptidase [Faecalibacterium sp.]